MADAEFSVRLVADDLTGALDAISPFAEKGNPVPVTWQPADAPGLPRAGHSVGTRDMTAGQAHQRVAEVAARWWHGFAGLAFKKVDSLWRGHAAAEIAAAMRYGGFDKAVVAPAFPRMGRITRGGRQFATGDGPSVMVADLVADLNAAGLTAIQESDSSSTANITVCDADDDRALDEIAANHSENGQRVLWCGSGGLATALAAARGQRKQPCVSLLRDRVRSIHVLVGTPNQRSQGQADRVMALAGSAEYVIRLPLESALLDHMPSKPVVVTRFNAPHATSGLAVATWMRPALSLWVREVGLPRLLLVTGGETLLALAEALKATTLTVTGNCETGLPISIWGDGQWRGVPLISKSGGFGAPATLADIVTTLLAAADAPAISRNTI